MIVKAGGQWRERVLADEQLTLQLNLNNLKKCSLNGTFVPTLNNLNNPVLDLTFNPGHGTGA